MACFILRSVSLKIKNPFPPLPRGWGFPGLKFPPFPAEGSERMGESGRSPGLQQCFQRQRMGWPIPHAFPDPLGTQWLRARPLKGFDESPFPFPRPRSFVGSPLITVAGQRWIFTTFPAQLAWMNLFRTTRSFDLQLPLRSLTLAASSAIPKWSPYLANFRPRCQWKEGGPLARLLFWPNWTQTGRVKEEPGIRFLPNTGECSGQLFFRPPWPG